jgi:hypothetical protein
MSLFSRGKKAELRPTGPAPGTTSNGPPLGRKLRSALTVQECLENFTEVVTGYLGGPARLLHPNWADTSLDAPAVLVAAAPAEGGHRGPVYLAIWDQETVRRMYLVTPDYAAVRTPPMIGAWKMRDSSLTSEGTVTQFRVPT